MADNVSRDMQLVVFRLGNEEYGADISQIREIIRAGDITSIPQAPDYVHGVINLRGQVTTVVNLRRRLSMPDKEKDSNSRIVIVEVDHTTVGMMVDSVTEVKYISGSQVEPFSGLLAAGQEQNYILGVCKLKDHLLILIDLKHVLAEVVSSPATAM
ncbi:MAG: purine-binding chemotaxis protein [Methanocella sp. PtaU1.Bin125]|nr:MAG: purine-binding chemotaxis protein [Methanocella sp. PtaU1.Bin125]